MPYECQNFKSGQVLTAQCMNKIDEWLAYICAKEITAAEINDKGELVFTLCNGSTLSVGVFSHRKLAEKDSSDQHPISAITGLSEALEKAIDETELQSAIENALAIAKESGEFDGDPGTDGTSVTVKSVSESTSDGGDNIVTFSDGNTLVVKNGTKGEKGEKGNDGTGVTILGSYSSESELKAKHPTGSVGDSYLVEGSLYVWSETTNDWANVGNIKGEKGDTGASGKDGSNGVSCSHSWSGTTLTVSSASGTSSANLKGEKGDPGEKGSDGAKGSDGYTPVKGTDYFTDADKVEMVDLVLAALPTWNGGSY